MSSPTRRTLEFLRDRGFQVAITEKWNPHAKIRQDMFGFIDVLAFQNWVGGVIGIQATAGSSHANRLDKVISLAATTHWLHDTRRVWVVSWRKNAKKHWVIRISEVFPNGQIAEITDEILAMPKVEKPKREKKENGKPTNI